MAVVQAGRQARPLAVYGQVHGVKAAEVARCTRVSGERAVKVKIRIKKEIRPSFD
jgi:hypothetical protein